MATILLLMMGLTVMCMGGYALYQTLLPQGSVTSGGSGTTTQLTNTNATHTAVMASSVGVILAGFGLVICSQSSPMMGGSRR